MKTMKSIRFFAFMLSFVFIGLNSLNATGIVYSLGKTTFNLTTESGSKSLLLKIENTGSERITVAIFDNTGSILKEETVNAAVPFSKRYDLSRLPAGDYTFSVSKTLMEKVLPFTISKTEVVLEEDKAFDKFSPMIALSGKHLDINFLLSGAGKVNVNLTNQSGEQVFTETVASDKVFNRRYNVKALTPGKYAVEVRAGGQSFFHDFIVE